MDKADLDLNTVLGILRRQKRGVLATLLLVLGLALAYLVVATPIYRAGVLIQVDGRSSNLLDPSSNGQEQSAILNSRVDSEVEILRSEATALAVVKATKLIEDKEFGPQLGWVEKLGIALGAELDGNALRRLVGLAPRTGQDSGNLVNQTLQKLQNAVDVRRRGLTYLIEISVSSTSPERAAEIANAYAAVYIERQVGAKTQATISARDVLRRQITTAQEQLAQSETAINSFIEANLSRLESETKDPAIGALRNRLNEAKTQQADRKAKVALADVAMSSGDWATVASTLGDQAISELARQRQELADRLQQAEQGSTEAINLRDELAALDNDLQTQSNASMLVMQEEMRSLTGREAEARDQLRNVLLESDVSAEMLADLFNLQQSATIARSQYQTLLAREQDLGALANLQIADARVVSEALPPIAAAFPNKRLIAALALIGGLGLGVMLAFLREFYVGGIVAASQLSNIMQAPVPVTFGLLDQVKSGADPADVVLTAPMSLYSETFRKLRAAIDIGFENGTGNRVAPATDPGQQGRIILVCSALQAEGKSTTAIALARTYALAGVKTLLIDADMRKPTVGKRLGLPEEAGLIDFVSEGNLDDMTYLNPRRDSKSPLVVIAAGARSSRPTDQLLNGAAFQGVMEAARERFDIVILDSPPILPVVDTRYLARYADAIVHVVRYATTTQGEVREAAGQMREHQRENTHYIGVLSLEQMADSRYGYYGNYGYYGEDS
ncbi:GumC family protein [Paragemmobacter straminiformis]|uniref:non-specific protein-tyrosine kinase n=1 Tax=Paragemmobacter straminiformis TaxID=2045119 RepID=A0A842I660_9RHOB|nr:polysaccharide biosynthesis tyrosine autokinase [Gemmobacter straminiformis]MBC2835105.1 polysaccharide biosynthesis tyrosine autokinase [Gemmobacter straminiformis]